MNDPLGPNRRAIGNPGMGGSIGLPDPDARAGFAYLRNRAQSWLAGDAGGLPPIRAVYDSLSG